MNTFFSLVSAAISSGNLGMSVYINKKQDKANINRTILGGIMVAIAIVVSLANTMYINNKIEKNGCK